MERSNLPRRSQPHLLAESVLELREEVGFYLSFQDEEVFQGLDLPQEEGDSSPAIAVMAVTEISDIAEVPEASPAPKTISKYPPHQPLSLDQEEDLEYFPIPSCPSKALPLPMSSPPPRALALTKPSTPPRGFTGVTSCLRVPKFEETGQEAFENTTSIGLVATPGLSSVCVTRVVKDDKTGLVYMDTVTTSVGRVILGTDSVSSNDGPVIEDITE